MRTIILSISVILLSASTCTCSAHIGVSIVKIAYKASVGYSIQSKEIQSAIQCSAQQKIRSSYPYNAPYVNVTPKIVAQPHSSLSSSLAKTIQRANKPDPKSQVQANALRSLPAPAFTKSNK